MYTRTEILQRIFFLWFIYNILSKHLKISVLKILSCIPPPPPLNKIRNFFSLNLNLKLIALKSCWYRFIVLLNFFSYKLSCKGMLQNIITLLPHYSEELFSVFTSNLLRRTIVCSFLLYNKQTSKKTTLKKLRGDEKCGVWCK